MIKVDELDGHKGVLEWDTAMRNPIAARKVVERP